MTVVKKILRFGTVRVSKRAKEAAARIKEFFLPRLKRVHMFHKNSLCVIMAAVTVGLSLIAVIAITLIVYHHADSAINFSIEQNNAQIVRNVSDSIDSYIEEMVSVSDTVTDLLSRHSAAEMNRSLIVFLRKDIETIVVFDDNGKPVVTADSRSLQKDINITEQSWYVSAGITDKRYIISPPHVERLYSGEYPWVITLTKNVTWTQDLQKHQGIMIIDMNFTHIKDLCTRGGSDNGYLYIKDLQNDIVYHPKQQMIYAGIMPEEISRISDLKSGSAVVPASSGKLSVFAEPLSNADWVVTGVSPMDGLATYESGPGLYVVLAILALALMVLFGSIILSRAIIKPIYNLMSLMEHIHIENSTEAASPCELYEADQLGKSFNGMVERIRQLMVQVRTEQEQLRRSELKALNAQINPHFLYNTLDSVVWLAENDDKDSVVKIVMALSKYFRLSLSGARDFIPVEDELQQVEKYLLIQKMRFKDVFVYHIECADNVRKAKTLKVTLQPIVENAIVHGIGTMDEGGKIWISAYGSGECLELSVKDNGCGIKPDVLAHILECNPSTRAGIGIKNVHQRIQLACGPQYGLHVESRLDEGTTVTVRLPLNF